LTCRWQEYSTIVDQANNHRVAEPIEEEEEEEDLLTAEKLISSYLNL
jgi:hypothetical protein